VNNDNQPKPVPRVIGFDSHPDVFTAAIVSGNTPACAIVNQTFDKVPMARLKTWVLKYTTVEDYFVLEASGNSFFVARLLASCQRKVRVLESCQMGKLKEAHANNDKISAVRIGKAYLAGTAKEVWIPNDITQLRRDLFHKHRKTVKATTRTRNSLRSYLSDNGVRLKIGTELSDPAKAMEIIRPLHTWTALQLQLIEGMLADIYHADSQRRHWRSMIAQEVLNDPTLLSLVRLCGVRELTAFALGAIVGDIQRFKNPKSLVNYIGLSPAFDDSGIGSWSGGIGGHGRKDLRCLLVEGAQAILRCSQNPLAKWGKRLLARKGNINIVVAAMARKLVVAIWYLLMGKWTALQEVDSALSRKVSKIITEVGAPVLKQLNKTRKDLRESAYNLLKTGRPYVLDPNKMFTPKAKPDTQQGEDSSLTLAQEYGVA
jgi:transposase